MHSSRFLDEMKALDEEAAGIIKKTRGYYEIFMPRRRRGTNKDVGLS